MVYTFFIFTVLPDINKGLPNIISKSLGKVWYLYKVNVVGNATESGYSEVNNARTGAGTNNTQTSVGINNTGTGTKTDNAKTSVETDGAKTGIGTDSIGTAARTIDDDGSGGQKARQVLQCQIKLI